MLMFVHKHTCIHTHSVDQFCEFVVQQECALWMLQLLMLLNVTIIGFRCVLKGILSILCMWLVVVWGHVF